MSLEQALEANTAALVALNITLQSGTAGAALVGTPATPLATAKPRGSNTKASVKLRTGDPEGTRYSYHAESKKLHVTGPGVDLPVGAVEISGDDYTKREADMAKNASAGTPATGAQTGSTSTATAGSGPSFQDVTAEITKLSKKEGGREKVVALLKQWGVEKFPQVSGKVANDQLLKDIAAADAPVSAGDGLDELGL